MPIILLHGAYNTWLDLFAMTSGNVALSWVGRPPPLLLAAMVVLLFGPVHLAHVGYSLAAGW